ncbi:amidohydrolase [Lutispora saccharofermentans]|uniref:Amidohydrolase n=1 Tax=Lutispora saccharofermentans TaxID=3024236 RepID=A0ABT1NE75_9FIRM|nr:amidohydrolase [Lutispora saccharofermentans]MCQ1529535.1 amidohydrolase [Lutispora saccharofermentans]
MQYYERKAVEYGADPEMIAMMQGGFTGAIGILECGEGPCTAFRFDIDCVIVNESNEESHVPYAEGFCSTNSGLAHSCGHDGHIAIGLVFAKLLAQSKERLKGKIVLIFQPAEEGVRGARAIINSGILPKIDFIIGGHIGLSMKSSDSFSAGCYGFLATDKFDVKIYGNAAHAGNSPEKGKNAMLAAANMIMSLYAIPRHSDGTTRINVGKMASGSFRNVIPEYAELQIEVRGETDELNKYMYDSAVSIIDGIAKTYGVRYEIIPAGASISAESSKELESKVKAIVESLGIYDHVVSRAQIHVSEDFTLMMRHVMDNGGLATYLMWGSDIKNAFHNGNFDFDEGTMVKAVKTLYAIIIGLG